MKVAVLGANGFVGGRVFETWQRGGRHQPRAIVRSPSSLARVARFDADWRLADARDTAALTQAFAGCEAVVHCVVGDERVIAATVEPAYRAASAAGVGKLVFLSSASVHGQNPVPGTTEETPLRDDQPVAYNNAKVRAERRLLALAAEGKVEAAILRPGIIVGPRSRWVADTAEALLAGSACWIEGGRGICNSIQVDNLVHAIERALATPGLRGEAFLLGDAEHVTWREFYLAVAQALGRGEESFHEATPVGAPQPGWRERVAALKGTAPVQRALPWFSPRLKESVKAALGRWQAPPPSDPWALPAERREVRTSYEMTELFRCATKLSHAKAERVLDYRPPLTFAEGMARCARWLAEVGYLPTKP